MIEWFLLGRVFWCCVGEEGVLWFLVFESEKESWDVDRENPKKMILHFMSAFRVLKGHVT